MKKYIMYVVEFIIILIMSYFILGYINYVKIGKNKAPFLMQCNETYRDSENVTTVCNGLIYKIIKEEKIGVSLNVKLKLWFLEGN